MKTIFKLGRIEKILQDSSSTDDERSIVGLDGFASRIESIDRAEKLRKSWRWIVTPAVFPQFESAAKKVSNRSPLISKTIIGEMIVKTKWIFETLREKHSLMERRRILKQRVREFYYNVIDTENSLVNDALGSLTEIEELKNLEKYPGVMRFLDDFAVAMAGNVKWPLEVTSTIRRPDL